MESLDYHTPPQEKRDWLGWPALVAAVPLLHFSISVGLWLMLLTLLLVNPSLRPKSIIDSAALVTEFLPASALFVLAVLAYRSALRRRRAAWALLLVILIGALASFWVDVAFGRWQMHVEGQGFLYFTWWWFH